MTIKILIMPVAFLYASSINWLLALILSILIHHLCAISYCECFAAGVYCIEPCSCQDCFNKPIHEDTVLATRKQIESRNPLAFAPKVIKSSDSVPEIGVENKIHPCYLLIKNQTTFYSVLIFSSCRMTPTKLQLQHDIKEDATARNQAAWRNIVNVIRFVPL